MYILCITLQLLYFALLANEIAASAGIFPGKSNGHDDTCGETASSYSDHSFMEVCILFIFIDIILLNVIVIVKSSICDYTY